jgi:hypothetical protein
MLEDCGAVAPLPTIPPTDPPTTAPEETQPSTNPTLPSIPGINPEYEALVSMYLPIYLRTGKINFPGASAYVANIDNYFKTGKSGTDDQACITGGSGSRATEGCKHGADKGERGTEENGAIEFGEQLIYQRADAGTKQSCGLAHAVTDDGRDQNGRSKDRKHLLEGKDQHTAKFGFVVDVVDKILGHFSNPPIFAAAFVRSAFFPLYHLCR